MPASAHASPDTYRRARLAALFAWVLAVQAPIFFVFALLRGEPRVIVSSLFGGLTQVFTLVVLKRSTRLGVHYLLTVLYVLIAGVMATSGGMSSNISSLLLLMPLMALMTLGARAAFVWFGLVALLAGGIVAATLLGVPFPQVMRVESIVIVRGVGICTISGTLVALGFFYERTQGAMNVQLRRSNENMALVFDTIDQGFLIVDQSGHLVGQRSAIADRWFGTAKPTETLFSWIARTDARAAVRLEVGWEALFDGMMPLELCLDQLPISLRSSGRTIGIEYRPILRADGELDKVVVVASDVTEKARAEEAEAAHHELLAVVSRVLEDPVGAAQFFDEARSLVEEVGAGGGTSKRALHTLKGNAAFFQLTRLVAACDAAETVAEDRALNAADTDPVVLAWAEVDERLAPLVARGNDILQVATMDLDVLEGAIEAGASHRELANVVSAWRHEATRQTFGRMGEQAHLLARRLGKAPLAITVEDHGIRLDPRRYAPLWAAMVHAVRNAVDHGLETPSERMASGKPSTARLTFSSRLEHAEVVFALRDDGRGVRWDQIATKAAALGMPHTTRAQLETALFADGLSTKVSDVSGRGVGMAALRSACERMGGYVRVQSEPGAGTTVEIRTPYVGLALVA